MSQLWHTTDSNLKTVSSKTGCGLNLPKLLLPQCREKRELTKLPKMNNCSTSSQLSTENQQPTPFVAHLNPSSQTYPSSKTSFLEKFQSPILLTTKLNLRTRSACGLTTLELQSSTPTPAQALKLALSFYLTGALHYGSIAQAASEFMFMRKKMLMQHHPLLFFYR